MTGIERRRRRHERIAERERRWKEKRVHIQRLLMRRVEIESLYQECTNLDLEKSRSFYDSTYSASLDYSLPPHESQYFECWQLASRWLSDSNKFADFGCGVGQFVEYALSEGKSFVYGVDFSEVAIQFARERNPSVVDHFYVRDLRDPHTYTILDFDVAILLEVLEHVRDDLAVLQHIPVGRTVILSVPSFGNSAHVRYFPNLDAANDRYSSVLNISQSISVPISSNSTLWLLKGERI